MKGIFFGRISLLWLYALIFSTNTILAQETVPKPEAIWKEFSGSVATACQPLPDNPQKIDARQCTVWVKSVPDSEEFLVIFTPDKEQGGMFSMISSKHSFFEKNKIRIYDESQVSDSVEIPYVIPGELQEANTVMGPKGMWLALLHASFKMDEKKVPAERRTVHFAWTGKEGKAIDIVINIAGIYDAVDYIQQANSQEPSADHQNAEGQLPEAESVVPAEQVGQSVPAETTLQDPSATTPSPSVKSETTENTSTTSGETNAPSDSTAPTDPTAAQTTSSATPVVQHYAPEIPAEETPAPPAETPRTDRGIAPVIVPFEQERFSMSQDDVVIDKNTGLMWARIVGSTNADSHQCEEALAGGYQDWRVPSVEEFTVATTFLEGQSPQQLFCIRGTAYSSVSPEGLITFKPIAFDYNKYDIRVDQIAMIEDAVRVLTAKQEMRIVIEGHCDERGTDEYNLALGETRAGVVRNYLVGLGVDPARIITLSYGESNPLSRDHNEAAWSQNRRVEIKLLAE